MPGVLLDTMVLGAFHRNRIPEKWRRIWKDVREGRRSIVLAEELLAELYHQISRTSGEEATRHWILWLNKGSLAPSFVRRTTALRSRRAISTCSSMGATVSAWRTASPSRSLIKSAWSS